MIERFIAHIGAKMGNQHFHTFYAVIVYDTLTGYQLGRTIAFALHQSIHRVYANDCEFV